MHTTASDGRLTAGELVDRCVAAGLTTMAVTDHDTVSAVAEVTALAAGRGVRVVPGVEVTAVEDGRDVHMLGYFVDVQDETFAAFLQRQRHRREERALEIGRRLAALGMPIDVERVVARVRATPGAAIARPRLARALVRAGHVQSVAEAFDRVLGVGQPAFVPRVGPPPLEVLEAVHAAGGVTSFAHPGVTKKDALLTQLAGLGLDAVEVYHSDHAPDVRDHYRRLAGALGLATSGGSDFHGFGETRGTLGHVHLPQPEFDALAARVPSRAGRTPA